MRCPACGTVNPDHAKFCLNCGSSLAPGGGAAGATLASPPKTSLNMDQYLPRALVDKLESARKRGAMLGERRVITMLFCDVKGSTAAAEKIDPELWSDVMNGVFERMIQPVYKYEGLVPRLMGDAILAFFGAPIAHEDDPRRAVLAALEIQAGVREYIQEIGRVHHLEFGLRVGINTGLVVVGEIGSDLRMEYTAIGDAINLAARMEQTALPGTVQVSEETYKLIAPFFECEELGGIEVKGKAELVKAWRVIGIKEKPGSARGIEGLSSPIVGRESQLSLLTERLNALRKGSGSFISILGEAGLGKSSLIAEAQRSNSEPGLNWCRGEALSYTTSVSYFPWRQLIRQSVGASESESPAQVRSKLGEVCECCKIPGGDLPFLEAMLAVESQSSLKEVMNYQGEALVQRILDAVRGYLCGLAMENPLVLVLDDLHWADEASLNLLLKLADLAAQQPILFICLLRPDADTPGWKVIDKVKQDLSHRYNSILLQSLPLEQTGQLLSNLLGNAELPGNLKEVIVEKAQGNPFFVEELIRSLIEAGQLTRQNAHWRLGSPDAHVSLPNTLRGVLSARIDRLPDSARSVLQSAAVVGRTFDLRLLENLTHLNGSLSTNIDMLQRSGLIETEADHFIFRHVLIQEAAYESILLKRRREMHLQIGELLVNTYAERQDEFAPLIARHFYSAGDPRSLKFDLVAGEKAARLYANAEAATFFSRALEVAKASSAAVEQVADIHTKLGSALELSGRYPQALQAYEDMRTYAQSQNDREVELLALMSLATLFNTFTSVHDPKRGEDTLKQALEISRQIGDTADQARLNWNLMLNYLYSNRLDLALESSRVALDLARRSGNKEHLAFVLNDLCRVQTCRGEFETAHRLNREARELWHELDNQVMLTDNLGSEGEIYFNAGEYAPALESVEQALQISEKIDNLWGQAYDRMLIGFIFFQQGQLGKGIPYAERAIELAEKGGLIAINSMRVEVAWIYAYCGAFDKALPLIERGLEFALEKTPAYSPLPQAFKVRIQLLQGDLAAALQTRGPKLLEPIPFPYARYHILLSLANIELACAQSDYRSALALSNEMLAATEPLTRIDIPEALRWKAAALQGLERLDEARQVLIKARELTQKTGTGLHLWPILVDLARIKLKLGERQQAADDLRLARDIVDQIAASLREVGLSETFLNQPRVLAIHG